MGSQGAVVQRPDTHDMVLVHRMFRREFRLLPALVRAVAPGDTVRSAQLHAHGEELLAGLHHHHAGEDELVWPKLLERAAPDAGLVRRMQQQHEQVAALLDRAHGLLRVWGSHPGAAVRDELAASLQAVSAALDRHLDEEERSVLPLCQEHMTAAEWGELGERGMAALDRSRVLVMLGHILEEATPEERARFLAHVPLAGRVLFKLVGERRFRREVAQVRGVSAIPTQRRP